MNNLFQDKLFYIFNLNGKKIKFFNQRMYSRMFRNFYSLSIWLRSYGPSYSQLGSCRKVFINKFRLVVRTLHRINDNFKNIRRTFESRCNCCICSAQKIPCKKSITFYIGLVIRSFYRCSRSIWKLSRSNSTLLVRWPIFSQRKYRNSWNICYIP